MICSCPDNTYELVITEDAATCVKTTVIPDILCPDGCDAIIREDGTAYCDCNDSLPPVVLPIRVPIPFDNTTYFKDVSWTISFKPMEGTWNSYFSFYPDYSPFHNNFFQTGYNWGDDKGTLWNHFMDRSSFCVFQGRKHTPIIEFIIPNENVNKLLNSVSLNLEGLHYINDWDSVIDKNKSFKNMFIYNQTHNTGLLELVPQKSLTDVRKYPITENDRQKILYTAENGKQSINQFFNRVVREGMNIPQFTTDENNIFKSINKSGVNFKGRRILERMKGEWFKIYLSGNDDTRFNLILKSVTNSETAFN